VLYDEVFPVCGCSACDERWDYLADDLEWQMFAIVGGGLTEKVNMPRLAKWRYERGRGFVKGMGRTVSHRIRSLDGERERSRDLPTKDLPSELFKSARSKLDAVAAVSADDNWLPWPAKQPVNP